jgi:hypothetical protein
VDYESRINSALGKILRNYNFLELNLGLCLRTLANRDDPSAIHGYLNRVGILRALGRLKGLLDECELISDTSEFDEWCQRVEEVRLLRNYYVHATWEYLPLGSEESLGFRIPPWRREKIRGSDQGRMRIEDLEADAERIETAFDEFMAIRRKYGV